MRSILIAAALLAAAPAHADHVRGIVHSFDAATGTLVMTDRTVWQLGAGQSMAPGQGVLVQYDSAGEDGITAIRAVEVH